MEKIDKIKEKIAHLLNLAKKAGTPAEAENAYVLAQKLLTKHSLSEADVVGKNEVKDAIGQTFGFYKSHNISLWKERLANILARNNGCYLYINFGFDEFGAKETAFVLVGPDSSRELVEYFFNSIVEQSEILCKKTMIRGGGKNWANNFKLGIVDTIQLRLFKAKNEAVEEFVKEKNNTEESFEEKKNQALVLLSDQTKKSEAWAKDKFNLKDRKINHSIRKNISALEAGRKAGNQISLHKGLKS